MSAASDRSVANSQSSPQGDAASIGAVAAPWPKTPADALGGRRVAFEAMALADLEAVCEIEKRVYAHPWSRRHFSDSIASGYPAIMLFGEVQPGEAPRPDRADQRILLGYLVAMPGVDEVHLLNVTVEPSHQRQGWGRLLLDVLCLWSRGQGAQWLWLEVRASNLSAQALYRRYGFAQVSVRRGYYPAGGLKREDAVVMSLNLVAHNAEATR